jgi:putative hydrolase of the HAD superfamily
MEWRPGNHLRACAQTVNVNRQAPIRAVTFDVGGTLIAPWPSVGQVYAEVLARHGRIIPAELLEARFRAAWNGGRNFDDTRAGWEELVERVFQGLIAESPRATLFPELYERFAQPEAWRIFEDVLPALDGLAARGLRLGVISNWDERLPGLLERLRLRHHFEVVIVSCEIGVAKPSPAIFHEARARLGLPSAAIVHVGDSLEMDVLGARSAAFHAVRIRRGAAKAIDGDIESLGDLPGQIIEIQGS